MVDHLHSQALGACLTNTWLQSNFARLCQVQHAERLSNRVSKAVIRADCCPSSLPEKGAGMP